MSIPLINDISTDLLNVPELSWRRAQTGRGVGLPERFHEHIRGYYRDLAPLLLAESVEVVFRHAVSLASAQPMWTLVLEDAEAGLIEGFATTRFLRFKDDFVIRLTPEGDGTRVDMRSKSRLGHGDFGVNAKRIRQFLDGLRAVSTVRPR